MSTYTTGELQLVYDLIKEFPKKMYLEIKSLDPIKVSLKVTDANLAGFVEHKIHELKRSREVLSQSCLFNAPVHDVLLQTHPEWEGHFPGKD
jgi:hypothetical protein